MTYSLQELATIGGAELRGSSSIKVLGICPAEEPKAGHLCFLRERDGGRSADALRDAGVAAVIVPPSIAGKYGDLPVLVAPDPVLVFAKLLAFLHPAKRPQPGINPLAQIHPSARIGQDVTIGPGCIIDEGAQIDDGCILLGNVHIYEHAHVGAGSYLHSGVTIRERCIVGRNCLMHNGAVIGADGFGFVADPQIGMRKVPQVGIVRIGDNVEIGANACVDRATIGETVIGSSTKLDNLVQVGHNVQIGNFTLLCASCKIGGSCKLGNGVVIGGGVGMADHCVIADGVRVAGMSGLTNSILVKGDYGGIPAVPARQWFRQAAIIGRLAKQKRALATLKSEDEPE